MQVFRIENLFTKFLEKNIFIYFVGHVIIKMLNIFFS